MYQRYEWVEFYHYIGFKPREIDWLGIRKFARKVLRMSFADFSDTLSRTGGATCDSTKDSSSL